MIPSADIHRWCGGRMPRIVTASACALAVLAASAQPPSAAARLGSAPRAPLPELGATGQHSGFDYRQLPDDPQVYVVTFADTGEQVLVSHSFLSLMTQGNMPEDVQHKALKGYPGMVQQHFDDMMETTFPDATREFDEPFEAVESTLEDGTLIQVNPDPLASPYVRITVHEPDGGEESFSLSRLFIDNMLAQEEVDGNHLLHAVTSFPFRLPETLRPTFANLTREELTGEVLKIPSLQRQEIIRMPRFYRERAAAVLDTLSNAVPHTAAPRPLADDDADSGPGLRGQRRRTTPPIVKRPKPAPAPTPDPEPADHKQSSSTRLWPLLGIPPAVFLAYVWLNRRRKS